MKDNTSTKDTILDLHTNRTMDTLLTSMMIWLKTLMNLIGKLETLQDMRLPPNSINKRDTLKISQRNT